MNENVIAFILELIQEVFDQENAADDPYTLLIPTERNLCKTDERLSRLSAFAGVDIEDLRMRVRVTRLEE